MTFVAINWADYLLHLMNAFLSNMLLFGAYAVILPPPRKKMYFVTVVLMTAFVLLLKTVTPQLVYSSFAMVSDLVVCLIFLSGTPGVKVVVSLIGQVVLLFAELPAGIFWIVMTDTPVMNNEAIFAHLPEYFAMSLFHLVIVVLLLYAFVRVCKRILGREDRRFQRSRSTAWKVFVFFPCVQLLLLVIVLFVSFISVGDSVVFMIGGAVVFAVCLFVDIALFVQMQNYAEVRLAHAHAEAMAQQVNGYLESAASMQATLRDTAVLRHDLRNHMQVVLGLCGRGERVEAQAYIMNAKKELLGNELRVL